MVNWKENWDGIRRWVDGEQFDPVPQRIETAAQKRSESERFLQKLRDAVEDILKEEITRIPNSQKAYIPEHFIVFLSEEANNSLREDKRKFFEQGLGAMVLETAEDMAGTLKLTSKKIKVSIAVNGILEDDEVEVRAMSEDVQQTIDRMVIESQLETIEMPENSSGKDTIRDVGTIRDEDFGILYRVEIYHLDKKVNDLPIILRKNTIGRDDNEKIANLRLQTENRKISRLHAQISLEDNGELWVTSLHENPTIVGKTVIRSGERARLGLDREIHIYDFLLKVVYSD